VSAFFVAPIRATFVVHILDAIAHASTVGGGGRLILETTAIERSYDYMHHLLNQYKLFIFPTERDYGFRMILGVKSDYFPVQYLPFDLCNEDAVFF
jgi:hypothetical protein